MSPKSTDAGGVRRTEGIVSDHAAVAINVVSYLHATAGTTPDRPLASALRAALTAAAETAPLPERYREFTAGGPATGLDTKRISVDAKPVAPALLFRAAGNGAASELDQVSAAAHRWRDALAERDRAILAAFGAGVLGQEIAAAAGMSVAGVYRLRQRTAGEFHRR